MIPTGYQLHTRRSQPWEPLCLRETEGAAQLTVEIAQAHCNARGFAHGGLISALADNAMGLSVVRLARRREGCENASAVTVSLALDFIETARIGDCVEFHPTVLKVGATLAFVDCRVICGERLIARANASFRMV